MGNGRNPKASSNQQQSVQNVFGHAVCVMLEYEPNCRRTLRTRPSVNDSGFFTSSKL
eukprot:m.37959 g.37959  ORF g.37959 m.37959 type:complete len:57 (-) comp10169_c0_seq5:267-437(-)